MSNTKYKNDARLNRHVSDITILVRPNKTYQDVNRTNFDV